MQRTRNSPKRAVKRNPNISRLGRQVRLLQRIDERTDLTISSDGAGNISAGYAINAANLIIAARLAGYQAIRDQFRIDRVRFTLIPSLSASTGVGRVAHYIERDGTAAAVANVNLASDQLESSVDVSWKPQVLEWFPQQPSDLAFYVLNPGTTTALATYFIVGTGLPATTVIYTLRIEVRMTLRGRP
jgi:hypothetical protein